MNPDTDLKLVRELTSDEAGPSVEARAYARRCSSEHKPTHAAPREVRGAGRVCPFVSNTWHSR